MRAAFFWAAECLGFFLFEDVVLLLGALERADLGAMAGCLASCRVRWVRLIAACVTDLPPGPRERT
jgi:hypothetical protein